MDTTSIRYILSRAIFLLIAVIGVLYATSVFKKHQRKNAIVSELASICSDSSFFRQFYEEEAKKSLVRAIALLAEANQLGLPVDKTIDRSLGTERKLLTTDSDPEAPPGSAVVRANLLANYQNFLKLGYKADFHTLEAMKKGNLPEIPGGPEAGKKAVVATIIPPKLSPGIEKVLANLEIRPPGSADRPLNDLEVAAARQLARDLCSANVIEDAVRDRIIAQIAPEKK